MKILIFSIFLSLSFSVFSQESVIMKGEAVDKAGKVQYIETHVFKRLPTGEITEIKTTYNNADGKLIAEVSSDFKKDRFVPDTIFTDYRFNEKQELSYDKESKIITMRVTNKSGKTKSEKLERTDNMVSGQGFHNYIIEHYNAKKSDIKFIVLPKLDFYSFFFEKSESKTPGQSVFTLKISSWILRSIVKEIVVEYRDKDHALMNFSGLTNIEADNRDSQILNIKMSYPGVNNDK